MNKITITLIGFLAIMFFTGNAFAGAFTNASPGADVTITGANSANLVFTPSPGILMDGATSATAFTIVSGNQKATTNAIVFLMNNASPVVWQVTQDLSAATSGANLTGNALAAGATTGFTQRE